MKITIITTTFNSRKTVEDTFKSILRQSFQNIEYLVIDGASNDGTLELIKEYEPKFEGRMHWVSKKDRSVYDAMNKGITMATGDVVGFLNSDDFFTDNDCLEAVVDAFENNNIDATYGNVHYVKAKNTGKMVRFYSSRRFRPSLMRLGFMPAHPSFYCKREVYQKYGLFDISYSIAADFELLLRFIYVHGIKTKYIHKDFVTMRMGGLSTSGFKSSWQILKEIRRALRLCNVSSNICVFCMRYPYKAYEVLRGRTAALMKWAKRKG